MPKVDTAEIDRMRDAVFFDGPDTGRRLSRFWMLLILAAIIASAGVVADSTATVIGAMIVAPLMTPIQATMLAVVIIDRRNLVRSVALVVGGAATAIAIGFALGLIVPNDVVAATNSQVAARVNPGLIDLLAASATGVVGSIALIRRDIADTLPGVAIAISLVPPLAVVGLTLEGGEPAQAWGALLLFITNVAAILASGSVVMALYGVHRMVPATAAPDERTMNQRRAFMVIAAMLLIVGVPLTTSTIQIVKQRADESGAVAAGEEWADRNGWDLISVTTREGKVIVRLAGPLPTPDTETLRAGLQRHGLDPTDVEVELVPIEKVTFERGG